MVLLMTERTGGELAEQKRLFESTGHRTYTLATSRGNVFTVMGSHAGEFDSFPGMDGQYSVVTPDVPYVLASRKIKDTPTVMKLANGAYNRRQRPGRHRRTLLRGVRRADDGGGALRSGARGRRYSAAAPSSRAPRPTRSRAWASRAS